MSLNECDSITVSQEQIVLAGTQSVVMYFSSVYFGKQIMQAWTNNMVMRSFDK
jgi:hypothetical protein